MAFELKHKFYNLVQSIYAFVISVIHKWSESVLIMCK